MPSKFRRALHLALLVALLGPSCATDESLANPEPTILQPAESDLLQRTIDRIAFLEDRRITGEDDLLRLATEADTLIRGRALRALGRLPFPEHGSRVTEALTRALRDAQPEIRAIAAFSLGLRADPASAAAILEAWKDEAPLVRARLVEAASRFEDLSLREEALYAISDPDWRVRAEAVTAPSRWPTDTTAAAVVDSALGNVAAKASAELRRERWGLPADAAAQIAPEHPEVVWRALFSLSRRKAERGRDVFFLWCRAKGQVDARIFATRGLASLEHSTPACSAALRECLLDDDWRVAVEAAVGLERFPETASIVPLERAASHASPHVRAAVMRALGAFASEQLRAQPILEKAMVDTSVSVRAAAVLSLARLFGDEVAADLETRALDPHPMVRKAVAQSGAFLSMDAALPLLTRLSRDENAAVAFAAIVGLGDFLDHGSRSRLHELLQSDDNGKRLAAVSALQVNPGQEDLQALLKCYKSSEGDISDEIQYEILNAVAAIPDDRSFEILVMGLNSARPYTRQVAREQLAKRFPDARVPEVGALPPRRGEVPSIDPEIDHPMVEIRTERGTMVFELFADVAPMHVYNFLALARSGEYDGLLFHRVVSDFVIQGGDYRGDGNGGVTWREEPLRHEFNEHKYVEGSLGMPRNADPESGGSQFFVTHRPTPHLDGRYTLFGELRQGGQVLAEVQEGDRILSVEIRGANGAF